MSFEDQVRETLGDDTLKALEEAIRSFEKRTSGELVVSFQPVCKGDPYKEGRRLFKRLKLQRTRQRNAVLMVLFLHSRKFAVLGDEGIDTAVPDDFWDATVDLMTDHFTHGRLREGLLEGIERLGGALAEYFPWQPDDTDEIADDIHIAKP